MTKPRTAGLFYWLESTFEKADQPIRQPPDQAALLWA